MNVCCCCPINFPILLSRSVVLQLCANSISKKTQNKISKSDLPTTLIFFICYANHTLFFFSFFCLNLRNPFNPSGPHGNQNMGVSETREVRMRTKTCSVRKCSLTLLVCKQTTAKMVLFTLESPQVTISTVFICYIKSVALIRPKIP